MYKLGFLSLNWPWFVLVIALIISIIVIYRLMVRTWGVLAMAVVLYLGVSWHMWTWVSWVFWVSVVIGLAGAGLLQWREHSWAPRLASYGSRTALAIGLLLLIVTTIGALSGGHASYGWVLTALVVGAFLVTLTWLLWRLTGKAALVVVACLAAAMIIVAGFWSVSASWHKSTHSASQGGQSTPTAIPTGPAPTITATVTATPTPTSTPTPTVTETKVVPRTSTVPPSTTVSTVVVSAPKAKTSTTSKPKLAPTHSKPKPSPTKAKPAKPVIVNVTTLSSVNVHDGSGAPNSSDNFCAVGNMPGHDEGVMVFTSKYGSFTSGVFTGGEIGGACTTYVSPSVVPPGGTDTVTVTLRDMNTGQSVSNVQTFKVQNSVHP